MANFIRDLSKEKQRIADKAKKAASEIVQDAIYKKFYGLPVTFLHDCDEPVDPYTFCCIPTEEFLQNLLTKLSDVRFMEDTDPGMSEVFAYVYPSDTTATVYLCELFWEAEDTLCKDSKPGTLIHEVSHLLGTVDIFYEHMTVEIYEWLKILCGKSQSVIGANKERYTEEVFQVNANSLEHEFETIINHKGSYSDGKYQCCEETKKNSVCRRRSTGHYHLHERFDRHKDEMERKLAEWNKTCTARTNPEGKKIRYAKKKNQACEEIPVSEP